MRTFLLASLLICAALTGCTKRRVAPPVPPSAAANTLVAGTLITAGGSWESFSVGERCTLVATTTTTTMEWIYTYSGPRGGRSAFSSIVPAAISDPWFIYVEAPDLLWFFDGGGQLSYRNWAKGDDSGYAIYDGILKAAPEDVPSKLIPHLPAKLQKLFPAETAKPRPSI